MSKEYGRRFGNSTKGSRGIAKPKTKATGIRSAAGQDTLAKIPFLDSCPSALKRAIREAISGKGNEVFERDEEYKPSEWNFKTGYPIEKPFDLVPENVPEVGKAPGFVQPLELEKQPTAKPEDVANPSALGKAYISLAQKEDELLQAPKNPIVKTVIAMGPEHDTAKLEIVFHLHAERSKTSPGPSASVKELREGIRIGLSENLRRISKLQTTTRLSISMHKEAASAKGNKEALVRASAWVKRIAEMESQQDREGFKDRVVGDDEEGIFKSRATQNSREPNFWRDVGDPLQDSEVMRSDGWVQEFEHA